LKGGLDKDEAYPATGLDLAMMDCRLDASPEVSHLGKALRTPLPLQLAHSFFGTTKTGHVAALATPFDVGICVCRQAAKKKIYGDNK
jgi:hypothetical protein